MFLFSLRYELVPLIFLLDFSSILILSGLIGIIWTKRDFLRVILCIELLFISLSIVFIFLSIFICNPLGQIYALFILIFAAAETTIALSILILCYRLGSKANHEALISLRL